MGTFSQFVKDFSYQNFVLYRYTQCHGVQIKFTKCFTNISNYLTITIIVGLFVCKLIVVTA